jgi:hypothetical protein
MEGDPGSNPKTTGREDTDALLKMLGSRKHVTAYVNGHAHRWQLS